MIGNEIITEEDDDDDSESIGFCEQFAQAASAIAAFIYKNSYIFTNVVMMVSFSCSLFIQLDSKFSFKRPGA